MHNMMVMRALAASCMLGTACVLGTAAGDSVWDCIDVNASLVSSYCADVAKPLRVCSDDGAYSYHKTKAGYDKQAAECSTAHKRKEQCSNNASACEPLTLDAYCGGRDQPCEHAKTCLSYCYDDCFPCNDAGDCDLLVDFGVVASPGAPCWSLMNSTGTGGSSVIAAAIAALRT